MEKNDKEKSTTIPVVMISGQHHTNHENIYAALSAFQGELKPMAKSGHVEFPTKNGTSTVKFDYTPLGEIMTTIYPLLAKHGLSVRHEIAEKGVEAILTHETAQEDSKKVAVTKANNSDDHDRETYAPVFTNQIRSGVVKVGQGGEMKDVGAAITYARRYTLTMVLGISSEDDKDAELLEQSKENAVQTVYDRFKAGVEKAKTVAEVEKSMSVLTKDLQTLKAGKPPALGMTEIHYEQLIKIGEARIEQIKSNQDPEGK